MRMSHLFGKTLRKVEASGSEGLRLLIRAGFLRRDPYTWLPLGHQLLRKCHELWNAQVGTAFQRIRVLSRSTEPIEEAVIGIAGKEIASYRDLPVYLETEAQPGQECLFHLEKDTAVILDFGFHPDVDDMEAYIARAAEGVARFLAACELEAPTPDGTEGWDWVIPMEGGGAELVHCPRCGYRAPIHWARIRKEPLSLEEPRPLEEIATPGCTTIEAVADFVGVSRDRTAKVVLYSTPEGKIVFGAIRGDLDVNEVRLSCALGWVPLKPATEAELFMAGIVAGYASPVGLGPRRNVAAIVADDSLRTRTNLVAGANKEGYHFLNVNYPRDFQADVEADIALARPGNTCPRCSSPLKGEEGITVASLRRTRAGITYDTPQKTRAPVYVTLLALYPERLAEAVAQVHHDERGLKWPDALAPYRVHLIGIGDEGLSVAEELYHQLETQGIPALFDDRDESPGVKFTDADLMGMPVRVVIGKRSLAQGGVEVKLRKEEQAQIVPVGELPAWLEAHCPPQ